MSRQTSLEERMQIVGLHKAGLTDGQIAEQMTLSVMTVRKWRRREQGEGRSGLASVMGRPRRGALSAYPPAVREMLLRWRKKHPGWGPKTLRAELQKHPAFAGQALPSRSSIGRLLKEERLTRSYERHSSLPQPESKPARQPHEVWEMDARGYSRVPEVGVVSLVELNDHISHARLLSFPVWLGHKRRARHVRTEDYQAALRLAFTDWGMPQRLQVDRDPVFVDPKGKSPFPRRLHLWLLALGIELVFGRPYHPRDQAITERSHQLWAAQCLQAQYYDTWDQLYLTLRRRRDFLNFDLPCSSLDDLPPLLAFPQAAHSGREYRPEWEADLLDLDRIWPYLAQGRWFRKSSSVASFSLAKQRYSIGMPHANCQLEITFDPEDKCLVCHNQAGELLRRLPIKGITKQALMGQLAPYVTLPNFQLLLPFDWQEFRVLRLLETMAA